MALHLHAPNHEESRNPNSGKFSIIPNMIMINHEASSTTNIANKQGLMKEEDHNNNLKRARVKMDEVREENQRLKSELSQIMKDYHYLKMHFNHITQDDDHHHHHQPKKSTDPAAPVAASDDESEFVSLSLGRPLSGDSKREEMIKKNSSNYKHHDGLELGLDCKSKEEGDNDNIRESQKSPKHHSTSGDDEILQHNPLKKPRVSVRAVCNTQTMNDGCQWRKYGQKIAKGNPCPRAYYRCTVSSSCPVRKQVQRCVDDMTILITTYEGTHNHPLPPSATAIAAATSAAAATLNCSSSTSPPCHGVSATSSTSPNLLGFNFPRAASQLHPTVVLDLTSPNHLTKFSASTLFSATHSSPTSLDFSSSSAKNVSPSPYYRPNFIYDSRMRASEKHDQKMFDAIKCDPSFRSALEAAIKSFVGTNVEGKNSGLDFDLSFSQPSGTRNGSVGWATSFLNKFPQL